MAYAQYDYRCEVSPWLEAMACWETLFADERVKGQAELLRALPLLRLATAHPAVIGRRRRRVPGAHRGRHSCGRP